MQKSNTITKTESGNPSSLAALRADAGMTQVELAAAVGVGQGRRISALGLGDGVRLLHDFLP